MLLLIIIFSCVLAASYFFTERIRRFAIINMIMDLPNHRSSHKTPTPRGGGLVIVVFAFFAFLYLAVISYLDLNESIAILSSFLIVSVLAWQDDKKHVSTIIRAACYFLAAACLVLLMEIDIASINTWLLNIVLVVAVVWIINLNNFMDGIDGIAGVQALATMLFAMFMFYQLQDFSLLLVTAIIIAAILGFLVLNWPPARIFMGDVGSCTLGLIFCIIALLAYKMHGISLLIWLILLSVFIVDATLTLIKRILTGQKWYAAHKEHAYQVLVQLGCSHKQVSLGVLMTNIILLWPLSYLAFNQSQYIYHCFFVAYFMLTVAWFYIIFHLGNKYQDQL